MRGWRGAVGAVSRGRSMSNSKNPYTGKTLFVPYYCVDEVEALIAKRRKQATILKLSSYLERDAPKRLKAAIEANSDKRVTKEDCKGIIDRASSFVPTKGRELMTGSIAYGVDYPAIYHWYMDGEKQTKLPKKPIDRMTKREKSLAKM